MSSFLTKPLLKVSRTKQEGGKQDQMDRATVLRVNLNHLGSQGPGVSMDSEEGTGSQAPWESSALVLTVMGTLKCRLIALVLIPSPETCLFPHKLARVQQDMG